MRPAAAPTREAAPGNSEVEGVGAVEGTVPLAEGVGAPEGADTAVLGSGIMYEEVSVAAGASVDTGASVEAGASEEVGSALDSTALLDSGASVSLGFGTEMVTPAEAQVFSTPLMTSACSSAVQAPCTQGVTLARSASDFSQWHLKSVRSEQPSPVNAVRKHWSWKGVSKVVCEKKVQVTYGALGEVRKLSRGNTGQSDEKGGNEGLHLDVWLVGVVAWLNSERCTKRRNDCCIPETCYRTKVEDWLPRFKYSMHKVGMALALPQFLRKQGRTTPG